MYDLVLELILVDFLCRSLFVNFVEILIDDLSLELVDFCVEFYLLIWFRFEWVIAWD